MRARVRSVNHRGLAGGFAGSAGRGSVALPRPDCPASTYVYMRVGMRAYA